MAGRGTDIKLSEEVKAAGGLAIIGTERHDSRRGQTVARTKRTSGRSGKFAVLRIAGRQLDAFVRKRANCQDDGSPRFERRRSDSTQDDFKIH